MGPKVTDTEARAEAAALNVYLFKNTRASRENKSSMGSALRHGASNLHEDVVCDSDSV